MPVDSDLELLISDVINAFLFVNEIYNKKSYASIFRHGILIKVSECPNVGKYVKGCCKMAVQLLTTQLGGRMDVNIFEHGNIRRTLIVELFNARDYPNVVDQSSAFLAKMCDLLVKISSIESIFPGMTLPGLHWDVGLDCGGETVENNPADWRWERTSSRSFNLAFKLTPISFLDYGDFRMQILLKEYL